MLIYVHACWGYLATVKFLKTYIQLLRFGLYFEEIMNRKWLLSCRNNDINYRDARGFEGHAHRDDFEMIDAIWYVLMYYFDEIKS